MKQIQITCPTCEGEGTIDIIKLYACPVCDGRKLITVNPDIYEVLPITDGCGTKTGERVKIEFTRREN